MTPRPTDRRRLSDLQIGLIAIVVIVFGFYLAFSRSLPFAGDGYELRAVFSDAQGIRGNSPVRVAGVEVGKVTEVEHLTDEEGNGLDAAVVTVSIDEDAQPIREDATMQLRPRLFLEGNLFVEMQPGTPGADELRSGAVIPIEQTASSVQFDQVLTSLQAPVREKLQVFLREFGGALDRHRGAEGFRETLRTSPAAFGSTAQVNEALLGTEPGDLAGVVRNLGDTVRAFDQDQEQLQDLVTNLRIVTGSFAAERVALGQGITELPRALAEGRPALARLNSAFPALRAFSREALPGVKAADRALDDANPFVGQLRALMSKKELRGLVKDLRPAIPDLAELSQASLPLLEEARGISSCFTNVLIPWGNKTVPNAQLSGVNVPDPPAKEVYKETAYGLAGVAGESRSGDANGQGLRVLAGGGTNSIGTGANPELLPPIEVSPGNFQDVAGLIPFELLGAQPAKQSAAKTPFRPDVPCETQEPPDLRTDTADPPDPADASATGSAPGESLPAPAKQVSDRFAALTEQLMQADTVEQAGNEKLAETIRERLRGEIADLVLNEMGDYRRAIEGLTGLKLPSPAEAD